MKDSIQTARRLRNLRMFCARAGSALLTALILTIPVVATTDQNERKTDYQADQVLKSTASVNPSTLALEFAIPISGYAGRGGTGLPVAFNYSSKVWQIYSAPNSSWQEVYGTIINDTKPMYAKRTAAGWSSGLGTPRIEYTFQIYEPFRSNVSNYDGQVFTPYEPYEPPSGPPDSYAVYYIKRVQVTMPDGSSHEFRKDDAKHSYGYSDDPGITGGPDFEGTFLSVDGSKMRLELDPDESTLYLPNGSRYLFGAKVAEHKATTFIDRNGNKMDYSDSTRKWTDSLGRVIEDPMPSNWDAFEQNQTVGDVTADFPGLDGNSYQVEFKWRYLKDPQGGESGLLNTSENLHYTSNKYCQGNIEHNVPTGDYLFNNPEISLTRVCAPGYSSADPPFNPIVLTAIELPNGQSYEFRYNEYGEIVKITYPTGAYARFAYSQFWPVQPTGASYDQANRGVSDRWVSEKGDGSDEVHWSYSVQGLTYAQPYVVTTTAPNGLQTKQFIHAESPDAPKPYGFGDAKTGRSYEDQVLSPSPGNQLLRRNLTKYTETGPLSGGLSVATRDMRPESQVSIIFEPGESYALAQLSETVYDTNSDPQYFAALNAVESKVYKYKVISLSTATNSDIDTIANMFTSSDLEKTTEIDYLYNSSYKARNITGLVSETRVKDSNGNIKAKSQIVYDDVSSYPFVTVSGDYQWEDPGTNYRGNPSTTKSWYDIAGNGYVETHAQYDKFGNARKSIDARGKITETGYTSAYKWAYPETVTTPVPDIYGTRGSNTAFVTSSTYDFNTGLTLTVTEPNGQAQNLKTEMEYDDPLLRPTKVTAPNGHETITEYGAGTSEATRWVKVKSQIDDTNWSEALTWYDGLYRTRKTQSVLSDGDVFVETEYDDMGRAKKVTNPYRTGDTKLWTENTFDDLSRVTKVTTPDGAEATTAFSLATSGANIGTVTTVTDQAGKQRRSITNGLGQLERVDEPTASGLGSVSSPNQATVYDYDTLNNLIQVNQGVQTRDFTYDSLSRLTSAENPESGTISYEYDENGNLTKKTDARGVVTDYTYDNINRVIQRAYSNEPSGQAETPDVTYTYDNLASAKGRLIKVENANSTTEYTEYDISGRVTKSKQTTVGAPTSANTEIEYEYNLSGGLIKTKYPSGREVQNELDNDGRLSIVRSKKTQNHGLWDYAKGFTYTAAGAVSDMQLGNGKWESTDFNSRLQPTQIALGTTPGATDKLDLAYEYETTGNSDNNGNVLKQTINVLSTPGQSNGFTAVQTYTYDELNRIKTAAETGTDGWTQTFTYDRYGNKNFDEANTTTLTRACGSPPNFTICDTDREKENPEIDPATNRIKELQPDGDSNKDYEFDAAGNTIEDPDGREFFYDGENKQIHVKNSTGGTIGQYWFDGDGKRVKKYVPSTGETTIFQYNGGGKLIAEYSTVVETSNPQVSYLTNDHLGSPRITTDKDGDVHSRRDFLPFGEELTALQTSQRAVYGGDSVRQRYTGYEWDEESGLDFAQTRMHSNISGRFTSPDSFSNDTRTVVPQSWNLYSYVRNNPLNLVDPLGKKGRVRWWKDTKTGVVHVVLEASFAIYGAKGHKVSNEELNKYKTFLVNGIKEHLEKEFNVNGQQFSVSADVTATTHSSEEEAAAKGADNIVELGKGELNLSGRSGDSPSGIAFRVNGEDFDRVVARVDVGFEKYDLENLFAHEFATHLLDTPHNTRAGEQASLFSRDGGNGDFLVSDFKSLVGRQVYNPPPSSKGKYRRPTGGLTERRATNRNNESPSSVYSWRNRVSQ